MAHSEVPIPFARDVEANFLPDAAEIVTACGELKAA